MCHPAQQIGTKFLSRHREWQEPQKPQDRGLLTKHIGCPEVDSDCPVTRIACCFLVMETVSGTPVSFRNLISVPELAVYFHIWLLKPLLNVS